METKLDTFRCKTRTRDCMVVITTFCALPNQNIRSRLNRHHGHASLVTFYRSYSMFIANRIKVKQGFSGAFSGDFPDFSGSFPSTVL